MTERNFYHRGSNGDIIYSLPTIIACGGRATLSLRDPDHVALLKNLLMLQPCIEDVKKRNRELERNPYTNLSSFYTVAWKKRDQHLAVTHLETQDKTFDLTQPWLEGVEPNHVADIIINRSQKYHDRIGQLEWSLLEKHADKCKFIGLPWQKKRFDRQKLGIEFHETKDALDAAQVIKGSKLFIGNQSLCFALAEAMKHPRCLEVCHKFNNCQPFGKNGYTCLTEELLDKYL